MQRGALGAARYNSFVDSGVDADFGKSSSVSVSTIFRSSLNSIFSSQGFCFAS
jgi:hypothetical protein